MSLTCNQEGTGTGKLVKNERPDGNLNRKRSIP